jgi:RNA polymerase sigma factor (sigma-70 family)
MLDEEKDTREERRDGASRVRTAGAREAADDAVRRCDADLVRDAAAGDDTAWRCLVERHRGVLRVVARSYRLPDAQVDDAVQTAWLRLFEQITRLRQAEHVRAWLVTTVRRECLRHLSAGRREGGSLAEDDPAWGVTGAPELEVLRDESHRCVRRALAGLPERQRSLLVTLAWHPELSYQQVSQRCSMPVGSIGPTRERALLRLRRLLEAQDTGTVGTAA